jgi:general secretion pathway protein K
MTSERGVALLSTLVIVAAVSALLLLVLEQTSGALLLARNARGAADVQQLSANAGLLAESALRQRAASLQQSTARFAAALASSQTIMVGQQPVLLGLRDAGDCFNLNSLVQQAGPEAYAVAPAMLQQMASLLQLLDVPPADAESLAQTSADWIDSDSVPLPSGAEDAVYLSSATPYRTGNTLMADLSEWRLVRGMTPALYDRLSPWFCTLPSPMPAPLAINTLPPARAPLLAALARGVVDPEAVSALLARRPVGGWLDVLAFWQDPIWQAAPLASEQLQQAVLLPRWLWVDISIQGDTVEAEDAWLYALDSSQFRPLRKVERRQP